MSDRLRDPIAFIRVHGWDAFLQNLVSEATRTAPWSLNLLKALGVAHWRLPPRERLAAVHLHGEGLEIGAQAAPLKVPADARVRYVDRMTREDHLRHFPHLDAAVAVSPDIITDGFVLDAVGDATQDFVIANHVLEHSPEPIGALRNWLRVLRPDGVLYCAVPIAERTFDRGRAITTLAHMIEDHEVALREGAEALSERNRTHYAEWLSISHANVMRDRNEPGIPETELPTHVEWAVSERQEIHFHTFTGESFVQLLDHVGKMARGGARVVETLVAGNEVIAVMALTARHR